MKADKSYEAGTWGGVDQKVRTQRFDVIVFGHLKLSELPSAFGEASRAYWRERETRSMSWSRDELLGEFNSFVGNDDA